MNNVLTQYMDKLKQKIQGLNVRPMDLVRKELSIEDMAMLNYHDEMGRSGTSIYAGMIVEDHVADIRGKDWAKKVNEIRRSDSNVAMVLKALKLPIKSANWYVAIDEDKIKHIDITPEIQATIDKQKRIIEKAFFDDTKTPFTRLLGEILTFLDHGYSLFEVTHKVVFDDKELGIYNTLNDIAFRGQTTIESWNVDKYGNLLSVDQWTDGDMSNYAEMEAQFLLHFAPEQEGDNYEGVSVLRPMWGNWMRKNAYLKWIASGNEKSAIPTPMIEFLSTPTPQEMAAAKKVLTNYTSGSKNFLINSANSKLTTFTVTFDPEKMMKCVTYEDQAMVNCILASFLFLGQNGNGGSLALGKDLSDFFTQTFNTTTDYICEVLQKRIISPLIDSNMSNTPVYVKLVCENMKDNANLDFANILGAFITNGVIKVDESLERWVREKYQYPQKDNKTGSEDKIKNLFDVIGNYYSGNITKEEASKTLKEAGIINADLYLFDLGTKNPPTQNKPNLKIVEGQEVEADKTLDATDADKPAVTLSETVKFSILEETLNAVDKNAAFMATSLQSNLSAIGTDYIAYLLKLYTKDEGLNATNEEENIKNGRDFYKNLMMYLLTNVTDDSISIMKKEGIKFSSSFKFSEETFLNRKPKINFLLARLNELSSRYEYDSEYMETKSELNKLRQEFNSLVTEHMKDTGHWDFKQAKEDLEARAETLISVQLNDLKKKLDLQYQSSSPTASSISQVTSDLKEARDKYTQGNDLVIGADIITSQVMNDTRLQLTLDIPEVEGYVYDAVIDSQTCPACIELDQYYFSKDDPNLGTYTPPLHPNSRATWKVIYKGDSIDQYKTGAPNLSNRALKSINLSECTCRRK